MAHGLKTRGLDTLEDFRKRVRRQYALGRISERDHDELIGLTNNIESYVKAMKEDNPQSAATAAWKGII